MNNKGFTLVELLAVMVILLAISVVAVTNITASLDKNDKREFDALKQQAINAAKIYFSMEDDQLQSVDETVTISTLISEKYLKDNSKFDDFKCSNGTTLRNGKVKVGSTNYQVINSSGSDC